MEFNEFLKQKDRYCDAIQGKCSKCDILQYGMCEDTGNYELVGRIIEKWADEHKSQTNADKFKEVFGIEVGEHSMICEVANYSCPGGCCEECEHGHNWWNQEYIPPESVKEE